MRILMISAEGPPLQRAGAVIDVMDGLPAALRSRGHEVCVALPFYREIRENRAFKKKDTGIAVDVQVGEKVYVARYLEGRSASGVQLLLIRCDEFFDRDGIYGEHGKPYEDNASRFIFFCKATLELSRRLTPQLQVLHAHDWAAALVPVFVRAQGLPFKTVLTIHHVADQGSFWGKEFGREPCPREMNLAPGPGVRVFGRWLRVVQKKGCKILVPLFDVFLWEDVRLIFLGEGDPAYETGLAVAARKFPTRFAYKKDYDARLAHLIEAGMDISLIPSQFEPAGLGAMYNLKYGALPVARATGGIHEIIEDYDPSSDSGYGFLCYHYSSKAFLDCMKRARQIFRDRELWTKLMKRAMARNFSWDASALRYEVLYKGLIGAADKAAA